MRLPVKPAMTTTVMPDLIGHLKERTMDKIIEKKTGWHVAFTRKALPWWLGALLAVFIVYLIARPNNKTLRVDKDTVTISSAVKGEFNDYIRISGRVQPMTTIQLSPQEGGIVEKILIEEGSPVKAGDAILILNNDNLDLQILNSEAELAEKENILRNTQIQMEQQKLDVRQNVLEYGMQVDRLRRAYEQQKALYEDKLIAKEEYLKAEEDYQLALQKYNLMAERSKQDSLYRGTQIDRMEESLENMQLNMSMIRRRKSNLIVKAPIDGELGLLDVVLGQSIAAGTKIGQINSVGTYKVEAQIDEHYIDRVIAGLEATFERQGEIYSTVIRKVYPEVRDGKFKADFKFDGEQPDNIRAGQTYYLNLQLGQPEEAVIIPRGTFYQKTGGKWIYVVNKEGTKAVKREIRIGRQNPQYYEVLEGLEPGEKVITSGYDTYGDSDVLVF
jgi:HlyD family secretion protein